jgi:hypothetical protein
MAKAQDQSVRRMPVEPSTGGSVRRSRNARSQPDSLTGKKSARGHRLSSGTPNRREKHQQGANPLVLGLGRVAETIRHVPSKRFKAALENAQHLVYRYPLQAMLVGVGLGYLLRRDKRNSAGTGPGHKTIRA